MKSNTIISPLIVLLAHVPLTLASFASRPSLFHFGSSSSSRLSLQIDVENEDGLTFDEDGPRVVFKAKQSARVAVVEEEGARSLLEYLALPAEKYSVLDSGSIERIPDSNSFVCLLDPIQFLGNTLIASIYADVNVSPYPEGKSVIEVTGCELDGGKLARYANGSFDVKCSNVVRALREEKFKGETDVPVLAVDCDVEVSALVPREGRWIPRRLLSSSGSLVMKSMLKLMVPRFVSQLGQDFANWSLGDDSRAPVDSSAVVEALRGEEEESFVNEEEIVVNDEVHNHV